MIRTIGDPDEKLKQDPVRMIRVIRHAARTGFHIEEKTYQAILNHREEIKKCSPSRVRDEFLRELKEGAAAPSLRLMIETGLLLSFFPDLRRTLGDDAISSQKNRKLLLSLFDLLDRLVKAGQPIPDSIILACFVSVFIRGIPFQHPFLGKREQSHYRTQNIRWAVNHLLNPFSFPKAPKEAAIQVLTAQASLKYSIQKGVVPKRFRSKKYFREAVLFFGIEAEATGRKVPQMIRRAVPSDLLPWWPKEFRGRRKFNPRKP
jgi:poly(A) polymerase